MKTLRTRLLIGLIPSLVTLIGLGLWAVLMFYRLGNSIESILRENYQSILAAERMKESLERMDSGLMFAVGGRDELARKQFEEFRPIFESQLRLQKGNITLPGEQKLTDELSSQFGRYTAIAERFFSKDPSIPEVRSNLYFTEALPIFEKIKELANSILLLNQRNMEHMDQHARAYSSSSIRIMITVLAGSVCMAIVASLVMGRSILEPIRGVTLGARAVSRGELDQVVPVTTRDELGELATAFNTMARTIREYREAGTARLLRAQKTAQATIDSFPDPVVVVDPTGAVERSNPAARRVLGVAEPRVVAVAWSPPAQLRSPLTEVLAGGADYLPTNLENCLCLRDQGKERFFLPRVLSIIGQDGATLGAAIVLSDVTKLHLVDQLKSDMVSTVSHELKTPLTGLQMAVHLLLEEVVGPLNPKQTELLLSARQDSDRLLAIINDLLDLTRIEQGRIRLDLQAIAPADLVSEATARFESAAESAEIQLKGAVDFGLPPVLADRERISHVFDNLIKNALAHTGHGGTIVVAATRNGPHIRFCVKDNGEGIPPEHLPRIFERFYRVPGSNVAGGVGLGLAITKEIVVSHGGQIEVSSRVGEETSFTFTLPIMDKAGDGVNEQLTQAMRSAENSDSSDSWKEMPLV